MVYANVLSASAARVQFMKMVRATARGSRFFIRHASGNNAVLLSEEEFASMLASYRLNRDPQRIRSIRRARRHIAAGKGIPYDKFRAGLTWVRAVDKLTTTSYPVTKKTEKIATKGTKSTRKFNRFCFFVPFVAIFSSIA